MQGQPQIALIEDDPLLREALLERFAQKGLTGWGACSAEQFYRELHARRADILVVDLGLPGEGGLELIRYIRRHRNCGVIAMAAPGSRQERLEAFRSGVDHYLVKPVDPAELLILVESLWRRISRSHSPELSGTDWQIDLMTGELHFPSGQQVSLTSAECLLLDCLLKYPNETITKNDLHASLFPQDHAVGQSDPHRIDVILSRIRRKVTDQGLKLPVRSVFGRGLVFVTDA